MNGIRLAEFPVAEVSGAAPFDFRLFSGQTPLARSLCPSLGSESEQADQELVRPVVLFKASGGAAVVVDGYRRVRAARRAAASNIPALVLPAGAPREQIVRYALFGREGGFTGVEQVIAVYKTALFFRFGDRERPPERSAVDKKLLPLYSKFFSREVSGAFLERLLRVLEFPREEQALLHALGTPVDQLAALLDLDAGERRWLLMLKSRLPFTASGTRKLILLFIFFRGRRPDDRFDLESWVLEKASSPGPGVRDKDLISELRAICLPGLTRREASIDAAIRALRFPSNLAVRPPENLEGDAYSCYFSFSSVPELEGLLGKIEDRVRDGSIGKLLDELNGD